MLQCELVLWAFGGQAQGGESENGRGRGPESGLRPWMNEGSKALWVLSAAPDF